MPQKGNVKRLQAIAAAFKRHQENDTLTYDKWRDMVTEVIRNFPAGAAEFLVNTAPREYLNRFAAE